MISGQIEIIAIFENLEFKIEVLNEESVLNFRSVLTEDVVHYNIRFSKNSYLMRLGINDLKDILG